MAGGIWDSLTMSALLVWPGVVLGCALLNMLISWTFSWSELVLDYFIGVLIGMFFFFGTHGDVSAAEHLFLTVSHGVFGLLAWMGVDALADPKTFFLVSASAMAGATVLSAALDHGAVAAGASAGGVVLSIIMLPLKLSFALFTTLVGLVIMLVGVIYRAATSSGSAPSGAGGAWFALIGGTLFFAWGMSSEHATTFGWVVNVFRGKIANVMKHELYHTRQYIYMHDWLGVFYFTFAALWGLVSAKIHADAKGSAFDSQYAFRGSADGGVEVGNPIEIAAYRL
jgi:hypothetical protein